MFVGVRRASWLLSVFTPALLALIASLICFVAILLPEVLTEFRFSYPPVPVSLDPYYMGVGYGFLVFGILLTGVGLLLARD